MYQVYSISMQFPLYKTLVSIKLLQHSVLVITDVRKVMVLARTDRGPTYRFVRSIHTVLGDIYYLWFSFIVGHLFWELSVFECNVITSFPTNHTPLCLPPLASPLTPPFINIINLSRQRHNHVHETMPVVFFSSIYRLSVYFVHMYLCNHLTFLLFLCQHFIRISCCFVIPP